MIMLALSMATSFAAFCCSAAVTISFSACRIRNSPGMHNGHVVPRWPGVKHHEAVHLPPTSQSERSSLVVEWLALQERSHISGQGRRHSGLPSVGRAAHEVSMQSLQQRTSASSKAQLPSAVELPHGAYTPPAVQNCLQPHETDSSDAELPLATELPTGADMPPAMQICLQPRGPSRTLSVELEPQASGATAMGFCKHTLASGGGSAAADGATAVVRRRSTDGTCLSGNSLPSTASNTTLWNDVGGNVSAAIAARWESSMQDPEQPRPAHPSGSLEDPRPEPAPPRPEGVPRVRFWRRQRGAGRRQYLPSFLLHLLPAEQRDAALSHTWTCSQAGSGSRWIHDTDQEA
jgi:hypothetical protein